MIRNYWQTTNKPANNRLFHGKDTAMAAAKEYAAGIRPDWGVTITELAFRIGVQLPRGYRCGRFEGKGVARYICVEAHGPFARYGEPDRGEASSTKAFVWWQ